MLEAMPSLPIRLHDLVLRRREEFTVSDSESMRCFVGVGREECVRSVYELCQGVNRAVCITKGSLPNYKTQLVVTLR